VLKRKLHVTGKFIYLPSFFMCQQLLWDSKPDRT